MRSIPLLALLLVAGLAQTVSGTWKLNAARSTFSGQTQPKSLTVRIEARNKGEMVTVDRTEANGQSTSTSSLLYLDGAAHDFEVPGCSGSQTSRRLDEQSIEILRQCAGGDWEKLVRRLAPLGKQLVVEITKQRSGRRFEERLVLERQ